MVTGSVVRTCSCVGWSTFAGVAIAIGEAQVGSILTRTSGYLDGITSHSLQPYRGCSFGRALCGVGCYVQHNRWLTRGARWGSFLEARVNAAEAYAAGAERERRWARRARQGFSIFMSSSTDPFVPHERRFGVTARVLSALLADPPDGLVVQTHSHAVTDHLTVLRELAGACDLRVHLSIESDRDTLPGLPPPASPVARRLDAAHTLRAAGITSVVTVAPLLPIADPAAFFARLGEVADAVVIDHFIGGDGSEDGARTARTRLPAAMEALAPDSTRLAYRDRIVAIAREALPGRVGISREGFAGRYT
jgi:DNA repair photolyase